MTVRELIRQTLRTIGAVGIGVQVSADEANEALIVLRRMLGWLQTQRLALFWIPRATYTLVSGQASYTVGPGGDFDQLRPIWLERVSIITNNNPVQPLELPIEIFTPQRWQGIGVKSVTSTLPEGVYWDKAFATGTRWSTMTFWPIPTGSLLQVILAYAEPLTSLTLLDSNVEFPPGYDEALVYNLAKRLAIEWGRPVDPEINGMAASSLADIKRVNIELVELIGDPALAQNNRWGYDYRSDTFR